MTALMLRVSARRREPATERATYPLSTTPECAQGRVKPTTD
jgi:hypothetical protein